MAENSNISWTDHTFNPWIGCTKVSPGCTNCYADTQDKLRKWTPEGWGNGKPRKRTSASNWEQPVKWNREAAEATEMAYLRDRRRPPRRPRVFCASLADWLDDEVPIEWLSDLLKLIHDTPNLDWLLLTKRPENWRGQIQLVMDFAFNKPGTYPGLWEWCYRWSHKTAPTPPQNIWIGTSVENQEWMEKRVYYLRGIPARVRFFSCEPLLGPVQIPSTGDIHWLICGGESGGKRREMKLEWAQSLHDQCKAAGVAFFMKQVSAFKSGCLDGVPADLLKQEFPK